MNILLVDDHISFLEGIDDFLSENLEEDFIVESCNESKLALRYFNSIRKIDLLISDLNLPNINGFELIRNAKKLNPNLKVIVLTMYYNRNIINKLKSLNVNGFISKSASRQEILNAIVEVQLNKEYISGDIKSLFDDFNENFIENNTNDSFAKYFSLSKREFEIMNLMLLNLTNKQIAKRLGIGTETIKSHRKNIYHKMGVNNVLDLYKLLVSKDLIK